MIDLENLSPADFEDLCRDLAEALTGCRFEAFGPGPDGGADGRHSKSDHTMILQCKHYRKSTFPNLQRSVRNEVEKVKLLNPSRYILFTSHSFTPKKKQKIMEILEGLPVESADILGREDIEAILRKNPDIHKAHIKLWQSSAVVLDRVLNSGLESFTNATREEILEDLRVYVRNESFDEAIKQLENNKVIIVSGTPGVGKTTLARMLTYQYLKKDWRFHAIHSLDDAFARIDDGNPTVFFFDDFLGRVELDRNALRRHDSLLMPFVKRIRKSMNARFILTTQAHIFEEARSISDQIDEQSVQLTKYLLDVGKYTRRVKAHILFNHLSFSDLTEKHFLALLNADIIKDIVDHPNYNPRIVSQVSSSRADTIEPEEFSNYVMSALNEPERIWEKPYKALNFESQNLLISLFFCRQFGEPIEALRINFNSLHKLLCNLYGRPSSPHDFDAALKNLKFGFISTVGQKVQFINPSVRDFINTILVDFDFLTNLPEAAERADWARSLWRHGKKLLKNRSQDFETFAKKFAGFAKVIDRHPSTVVTKVGEVCMFKRADLSLAERAAFLCDIAFECGDLNFLDLALSTLNSGRLRITPEEDARFGIELYCEVCVSAEEGSARRIKLLEGVEELVATAVKSDINLDELVRVIEVAKINFGDEVPENIQEAIDDVIDDTVYQTLDSVLLSGTDRDLSNEISLLGELEELTGCDTSPAIEIMNEQHARYEYSIDYGCEYSSYIWSSRSQNRPFDDQALNSLFMTLVQK